MKSKLLSLLFIAMTILAVVSPASAQGPWAGQVCWGCINEGRGPCYIPTYQEVWASKPHLHADGSSGSSPYNKLGTFQTSLEPNNESVYHPGITQYCEFWSGPFKSLNFESWYVKSIKVEVWALNYFESSPGIFPQRSMEHKFYSTKTQNCFDGMTGLNYRLSGIIPRQWSPWPESWQWALAPSELAGHTMNLVPYCTNDFPSSKGAIWEYGIETHQGPYYDPEEPIVFGPTPGEWTIENYRVKFTVVFEGHNFHNLTTYYMIPFCGWSPAINITLPCEQAQTITKEIIVDGGYDDNYNPTNPGLTTWYPWTYHMNFFMFDFPQFNGQI